MKSGNAIYILEIQPIDSDREEDWLEYSEPERDLEKLESMKALLKEHTLSYRARIIKYVASGEVS